MRLLSRGFLCIFPLILVFSASLARGAAEPKVQILSPKEGSSITQQQNSILISGKVASQAARSENVDIMFIIAYPAVHLSMLGSTLEISGSCPTVRARVDLAGPRSLSAALGY